MADSNSIWRPGVWLGAIGRPVIRLVDLTLQRVYGLWYFSREPDCILRLSWTHAADGHAFADGTVVRPGDRLLIIHIWNERLPRMGPAGPDLAWGRAFYLRTVRSLHYLAAYAESAPELAGGESFWGEMAFLHADAEERLCSLLGALGFEVVRLSYEGSLRGRCPRVLQIATSRGRWYEFWANFYSWLLIWLYNPASLKGKSLFDLRRYELWLSRRTLLAKYGPSGPSAPPGRARTG